MGGVSIFQFIGKLHLIILRNICFEFSLLNLIFATKRKSMTQIILDIENKSILPSLRKVLSAIPGVKIINNKAKKAKAMTPYEKSLKDVEEGRVYEYDSLNDFIKEIG